MKCDQSKTCWSMGLTVMVSAELSHSISWRSSPPTPEMSAAAAARRRRLCRPALRIRQTPSATSTTTKPTQDSTTATTTPVNHTGHLLSITHQEHDKPHTGQHHGHHDACQSHRTPAVNHTPGARRTPHRTAPRLSIKKPMAIPRIKCKHSSLHRPGAVITNIQGGPHTPI